MADYLKKFSVAKSSYPLFKGGVVLFSRGDIEAAYVCPCGKCGNTVVMLKNGREYHIKGDTWISADTGKSGGDA